MRDYSIVKPQFWTGETGKKIKALGPEIQVLALYLFTSPHANMLGIYYLPVPLIAHETGLSLEGALKGLRSLFEAGFCSYDAPSEYVWVHEMARHQNGDSLKPTDNRVKAINSLFNSLPESPLLKGFYEKYKDNFHIENARGLKAPSKPLRSQEQDQEQDQEQEENKTTNVVLQKKTVSEKVKVGKESRKHRLPDDFRVTDEHRDFAKQRGYPSPDEEFEAFKDHHLSLGNKFEDWNRAFKSWLRKAKQFSRAGPKKSDDGIDNMVFE